MKNITPMLSLLVIKDIASKCGFDLCGVAKCQNFTTDRLFFDKWIDKGYAANLEYLKRNRDKRADASQLVENAKSVIVCAVSYKNRYSTGYHSNCHQKIASYALTTDYHTTIKEMLRNLFSKLKQIYPTISGRIFVDSAPIFEKRYAVEAGLGWIGKQSLLITPQFGSFVLLGVAVITDECDQYDVPLKVKGCGECRRCIDACPNGAIKERHIDTRLCISRATIESEGSEQIPLHGWVFGCDECQSCCPYNAKTEFARNSLFTPTFDPTKIDWHKISEAEFSLHFATTPLSRSSLKRIEENLGSTYSL